jgi:hypothetical protein
LILLSSTCSQKLNAQIVLFRQVQPATDEALLIIGDGKAGLPEGGGLLLDTL